MSSANNYCDFPSSEEFSGNRQAPGRSATRAEPARHRRRAQVQTKLHGLQTLADKPSNLHDRKSPALIIHPVANSLQHLKSAYAKPAGNSTDLYNIALSALHYHAWFCTVLIRGRIDHHLLATRPDGDITYESQYLDGSRHQCDISVWLRITTYNRNNQTETWAHPVCCKASCATGDFSGWLDQR